VTRVENAWLGDLASSNPNSWNFSFTVSQYGSIVIR
jgi:hypothetical protein